MNDQFFGWFPVWPPLKICERAILRMGRVEQESGGQMIADNSMRTIDSELAGGYLGRGGSCMVAKIIQCVLFDVDNTLVDSDPLRVQALRQCGHPNPERIPIAELRGKSPSDLMRPNGAFSMSIYWRGYRRAAADGAKPTSPMLETTLERLRANDVALGIVTSSPREEATYALARVGLADFFGHNIIGYGDCRLRKPHGDPIRKVLERLGYSGRAVYVGDCAKDAEASRDAGVAFALAWWGAGNQDSALARNSDYVLRQPEELLDIAG